MASLIPALNTCLRRMTAGERRLAQRLEAKLEGDYLIWYEVPVGGSGFHPDFIVLHPRRGVLILEVKDWNLGTIQSIDKARATLLTQRGMTTAVNPFEQARGYAQAVASLLQKDSALTNNGRLVLPWGYGVVLTHITRKQFDGTDLGEVLPPDRVICQDEMIESVDAEAFQEGLWNMFPWVMRNVLTLPQIDRVRWSLFPEIHIGEGQRDLFGAPDPATTVPDLIRIMDLQQEQLARSLGEDHRVIHGVAGSGKTLILGYRCLHLAKTMSKPILVLCYNLALASRLAGLVREKGLERQVTVQTFHAWCRAQHVAYHVPLPPDGDGFFEGLVTGVIGGVERGQVPAAQYGAVLIDEGHDFEPAWLKLVAQLVDPETNALLLLYDDAQSIYGHGRKGRFSFKQLGIQAQGRTTILRLNYRNTAEVLALAYGFAKDVLADEEADEDGIPLVRPESAERHGPQPELIRLPNVAKETAYIAGRFLSLHDEGVPWRDMAVLYRTYSMGEHAASALRRAGIPVQWLKGSGKHYQPDADSVKVVTFHSSKGLEFPVAAIPGLGALPLTNEEQQSEVRLMYVGMTRAMERLIMTCDRESTFVERLGLVAQEVAA